MVTPGSDQGDLIVLGTTIAPLGPNESTRMLGIKMTMDGTLKDELKFLVAQSKMMATKLYTCHLSPLDSFMVYETRYRPAL